MKKIFLATGIMMVAATTFAHDNIDRRARKEARTEKREVRREAREERNMARKAENQIEVSNLTKEQFATDYPDARNVHYKKTNNYDEVFFTSGRKALRAYYDYDNKLVGTTQTKSFTDLPENAQKEILKKYAGYSIADVVLFRDNEDNNMDMILYDMPFDDADSYFVELKNDNKAIALRVDMPGYVYFFKDIK
jgi:hypothetical protein